MKNIGKNKTKYVMIGGAVIILALLCAVIRYFLPAVFLAGILLVSSAFSKPKVFSSPADYSTCIGAEADPEYGVSREGKFKIFPASIDGDQVIDFQYTYYNPWDAQEIVYLTVCYEEQDYVAELSRLSELGIEEYDKYYSVTDEPEGYDLVAMDSDDYEGFVYAMVPEEENRTITYVGINFCNYFLDLDINKYLPKQYLLLGFDATPNNPYERDCRAYR